MNRASEEVCAIYVRVSTTKLSQQESPEHQRMICLEKARMEELDVQFEYEDRSTGTIMTQREDMINLINDAQQGYYRTVIFASLSRFSRDMLDSLNIKRMLVDALSIRLISIDEGYDSKYDKDEFKFQLISAVNQKLSEQISISSRRGIRQSARKGNFTGSLAPYGYKKINIDRKKTLEICDKEAEIVKIIFDFYCSGGMGEKAIINYLNKKGIPSPKGNVWGVTTIQRILQNEAYTGRNVYSKYHVKKVYNDINNMQDRSKKLVQRDKDSWEKNEEKNWESIIDDETFKKAQKIRLLRGGGQRGGARNVTVNPLTGLIKCSHCGSNFVSMKSGKEGKGGQVYRYLICSSRRRMGVKGCENDLWLPLHDLTDRIINSIKTSFSTKFNAHEISKQPSIENSNVEHNINKKKSVLEKKIQQNRKLLFEFRKDYKLGEIEQEQYLYEKEILEKEIAEYQLLLSKLVEDETLHLNTEEILEQIRIALVKLGKLDLDDVSELQVTLKVIIDEIKVNKNGVVEIYSPLGLLHL